MTTEPTREDFRRYAELVQAIRRMQGLLPTTSIIFPDDPRPFIKPMEEDLREWEARRD